MAVSSNHGIDPLHPRRRVRHLVASPVPHRYLFRPMDFSENLAVWAALSRAVIMTSNLRTMNDRIRPSAGAPQPVVVRPRSDLHPPASPHMAHEIKQHLTPSFLYSPERIAAGITYNLFFPTRHYRKGLFIRRHAYRLAHRISSNPALTTFQDQATHPAGTRSAPHGPPRKHPVVFAAALVLLPCMRSTAGASVSEMAGAFTAALISPSATTAGRGHGT